MAPSDHNMPLFDFIAHLFVFLQWSRSGRATGVSIAFPFTLPLLFRTQTCFLPILLFMCISTDLEIRSKFSGKGNLDSDKVRLMYFAECSKYSLLF